MGFVKLRVRYERPSDLVEEHDSQMSKGGLLVRGDPPAGLTLYGGVELEIAGAFAPLEAAPVVVHGQVVQMIAGVGVAVAFDAAPLAAAVAAARGEPRPAAPPRPPAAKPPGGELADKIQQALHGNKDDRMRILRESLKMLHSYVLRNPGLGLDEVLAMAKMSTLAPDIMTAIAERREWASRPDIAIALVRNHKTPVPIAVKLLDYVAPAELRQLAKDNHARDAVRQAARKRVLGGS